MAGNFYGVVTRTGHGLITAALASGTRVNLTHIALGDGGGAAVAPSEEMQTLVNEVHRAPINTLAQDPANAALMWAEVVLPANVGGWYIREAGILDEEGNLVAVAGTPESYKPALAEGSGSEFVLRLPLVLTNTESVTLRIDPTVVLASREHVAGAVAGHNAAADAHADIRALAQGGESHAGRRDNPHEVTRGQLGAASLVDVRLANQRIAVLDGLFAMRQQATLHSLVYDLYEPFTDLEGMDEAASSGVDHDAEACCISNPGGFTDWADTGSDAWNDGGYSSYWTWDGNDLADTGSDTSNAYNKAMRTVATFDGDFAWRFTHGPNGVPYWTGIYAADEDAKFSFGAGGNAFGLQDMSQAWFYIPNGSIYYGGSALGALAASAVGDVWEMQRRNGEVSLWKNGELVHTWAQTYAGPVRMVICGYDGTRQDYDDIAISETRLTAEMTYQSKAMALPVPPEALYLLAFVGPGEGAVYNTDVCFELTADGGATWTSVPVEKQGESVTGLDIVSGTIEGLAGDGAVAFRVRHSAAVLSATHFIAVQA